MKRLTILLLFTSIFGSAQIDYKGLVKNLEDVTIETDIREYLKALPYTLAYGEIEFNDERFLRFHNVIIDKVRFKDSWSGKIMVMELFDEKEDYESIKTKLSTLYGEPEINERSESISYEWETDKINIDLEINTEDEIFISFDQLSITFLTKQ